MQVDKQIDELLSHRASQWFDVLRTASKSERAAFVAWLAQSQLHVQAFLEVAEIEFQLDGVDRERRQDIDALLRAATGNVVALDRPAARSLPIQRPRKPRLLRIFGGAIAACATAVAAIGLVLHLQGHRFETAVGEQKSIELSDSSTVILNASSRIDVQLREMERDVELRQGEAIFKVAHDPERPFRVHTRAGIVEAVGTQFNVYERPNGVTRVSVLEGRVRLIPASSSGSAGSDDARAAQLLNAGEEADIHLDGRIRRNQNASVANTVAWRQRRLVFDNVDLAEMVAEFNRYNRAPRLLLDEVPADKYRFSGVFDAADPESFVSLLAREPDLSIERRAEEIVIRVREGDGGVDGS